MIRQHTFKIKLPTNLHEALFNQIPLMLDLKTHRDVVDLALEEVINYLERSMRRQLRVVVRKKDGRIDDNACIFSLFYQDEQEGFGRPFFYEVPLILINRIERLRAEFDYYNDVAHLVKNAIMVLAGLVFSTDTIEIYFLEFGLGDLDCQGEGRWVRHEVPGILTKTYS